VYTGQSGEL
jgi:hypothetical protein